MYSNNRMMASDEGFLRFIVPEDNECKQCTKSESPTDSSSRIYKDTQSNTSNTINNCSKCASRCGSFQLDYSNDFYANTSGGASSSSSTCSEQHNCGSSQIYYPEDFHTDSTETTSSSRRRSSSHSSSSSSSHSEQPETKEEELPKKINYNNRQATGSKISKKKQQQKTYFNTNSVTNSQKKNSVACRILSARLRKVKEMKSEISVLKNKLEVSNIENQLLKRLQYRHLKEISKYENAESNLPDLMSKHCGEVRTLRALLRKSQEQERNASRKLREVDAQLLKTKDTLQALQKLSEDKNLAERAELKHRLTALTERMEASDKRIQGLEKQLLLNNTSFSHQLAVERKKTLEAQKITTNLQMEIKSLNQKIKEKERELGIRNIYANRMLKSQQDKDDTDSLLKDINVSKSIQVDMSFELEAMIPLHKHETEKSAIVLKKEMTTKDKNSKDEPCDAHEEMKLKPEELLRKEMCPSAEKHFKCENLERQMKRRDRPGVNLLKEEFEKLRTTQLCQPTQDILQQENILEEAAVEKQEKEEKISGEPKDVINDKLTTLIPRHRTPSKLKKQYVFTEATENLHQGFPSSGPISSTSGSCNNRHSNRHHSEIAEFKAANTISAYEPSFGKVTRRSQKDTLLHGKDHITTVSMEKKSTLMEELFGPSCILNDSHPNPDLKEVIKEKKTQSKRISYINDSLQSGDSKQAQISFPHSCLPGRP